jgi:hypothetical protein
VVTYLNNYRINNVVERSDYYPFGGRWDDGARVVDGIKFKSFTERNFRDNPTPTTDQLFDQAWKLMI